MRPAHPAAILGLALLSGSVGGATLPFSDGFEAPEVGFSNWTTTCVSGGNTLSQSTANAWDKLQSLQDPGPLKDLRRQIAEMILRVG